MTIDTSTQLNLVIGNPVKHSRSPELHKRIYEQNGINAIMLAIENPNLSDLIVAMKTLNMGLIAVTLPFKTQIIQYADVINDAVKVLGAANTLILKNGQVHAHNTDVDGINAALKDVDLNNKKVLILGAGGAARAVAYALKDTHADLFWMNRTKENAEELSNQFGGTVVEQDKLGQIDLIINTTSVGMSPKIDETPLPDYVFNQNQTVFDLVYTPKETRLLSEARKSGAHCISGEIMFVEQALKQVELCYGISPQVEMSS